MNPVQQPGSYAAVLRASCDFLGLNVREVDLKKQLRSARKDIDEASVESRIVARNAARKAKDFKEADRIRDELAAKGIVLKDSPTGTIWEVKR
jgi:cysteinyl-tRNA synthetase